MHTLVVVGAGPLSGADHSISHCSAQMANSVLRLGGMNMIRAGGAATSAGSVEALCVLKATFAGLAEYLSVLRLSASCSSASAVCCSWHSQSSSPLSGILCWPVGCHLAQLLSDAWDI